LSEARRPIAPDFDSDTIEVAFVADATVEVEMPEIRAAETHREIASREKRSKKLARVEVRRIQKKRPGAVVVEEIAKEGSGVRRRAERRRATPPPPPKRVSPPPVPTEARRASGLKPSALTPSVPPPVPQEASPVAVVAFTAAPITKRVLHIPSREATQQFALPGRENAIPLSRVAPHDIAVPLVPTASVPLIVPQMGREDTQEVLTHAPVPFAVEDPNEDLLAPYTASPLRSFKKALSSFFD
jgi:hypothetical protein